MNMKEYITSGIRPPHAGDKAMFICKDCGHRFTAALHILPLPVKCPECGSLNTERDRTVVY
jgi:predicted Zn-ribbon and HTH transcriptional regulator